jgi:hypothetical protein
VTRLRHRPIETRHGLAVVSTVHCRAFHLLCALAITAATAYGCGTTRRVTSTFAPKVHPSAEASPEERAKQPWDPEVAAKVGRHSITRVELARRVRMEALRLASRNFSTARVSRRACLTRLLTAHRQLSAGVSALETAPRKCRKEYGEIRDVALSSWIEGAWMDEEASRLGLAVSSAEVDLAIRRNGMRAEALASFGVSRAEVRLLVRPTLLQQKAFTTLPAFLRLKQFKHEPAYLPKEIDGENAAFVKAMDHRWAPRTECQPALRIHRCSGYRGKL